MIPILMHTLKRSELINNLIIWTQSTGQPPIGPLLGEVKINFWSTSLTRPTLCRDSVIGGQSKRVRSGPENSPRASVSLVIKIKCLKVVEMRKAHHIIRGD